MRCRKAHSLVYPVCYIQVAVRVVGNPNGLIELARASARLAHHVVWLRGRRPRGQGSGTEGQGRGIKAPGK